MATATIVGDGGWGTALALVLHRNGHQVRVWGPFPEVLDDVTGRRENVRFLPGVALPVEIEWTADPARAAAGADAMILATPSQYFTGVLERFRDVWPAKALGISVTKGLDRASHRRMTELAQSILDCGPLAALSGPSFADEVARGLPSAVVAASRDAAAAKAAQRLFVNGTFRVYTSDDICGVELGGALKNVMAIAAGACDGLGLGANTKAALATRGLAEMTRLGVALGAHASTFAGLSGVGDLMLTCFGRLSRNRAVGERLGQGERAESILSGMAQVAEGVTNAENAAALAREAGVDMPIVDAVRAVIRGEIEPREAVTRLMGREPRPERDVGWKG